MTVNGDDLLINRSFGYDIRHYSLSNMRLVRPASTYLDHRRISVTTIRLNSNRILALAIAIDEQQMIDLVNLNTDRLLHRVCLPAGENILYPVDLNNNGQWFAKTCTPGVHVGHVLISADGQVTKLNLFPRQDNFVRSLRISPDNRRLLVGRQHCLEIYQPFTSLLPYSID